MMEEDSIKLIIIGVAGALTILLPSWYAVKVMGGLKNMKYVEPEDSK